MIVRVLRGTIPSDKVQDFHERATASVADVRGREGLVYCDVGRQVHPDNSEDVIFLSVWTDLESLYRWIGVNDLLETPLERDCPFIHVLEVQHYETLSQG